jgi:NAD(P)-dependent dehydrogenase (short-subunit alcohol dehydrogenase family)
MMPQSARSRGLHGKVAIVTGAAQGLGAVYARALAQEGVRLVLADILDASALEREIGDHGGSAVSIETDVASPQACAALVRKAEQTWGPVDILVNNAALFASLERKPFERITQHEWDRVMAVNVRGPFNCAQAVVPGMRKKRGGKIVNISSATVFSGTPGMLHYVTSKGAVVAFTRALARELGDAGIVVNGLAPGLTMSEGLVAQKAALEPYTKVALGARAIKREQIPDDLVGALLFLACADSDFMTGQTLVVDGGYVMR